MISYILSQIALSHHSIRNHEREKAYFELFVLRIIVHKMFYSYRCFIGSTKIYKFLNPLFSVSFSFRDRNDNSGILHQLAP